MKKTRTLPNFRYPPDPLSTGSIVESDARCACWGKRSGFIYTGPTYAIEVYDDCICPWCIADGSAPEKLGVTFTCEHDVGCGTVWDKVPGEVAYRTPGFQGWEQSRWWTHCGDAAQFLGRAGREELEAFDARALAVIQQSVGGADGPEWDEFFAALKKDGAPMAYLFRCSKCGQGGGYADCD